MDHQQDQDHYGDHKYVVVCIDAFCSQYGVRKGTRSRFGLYNEVENLSETSFEQHKREMGRGKREVDEKKLNEVSPCKKPCYGVLSSMMEGSTLEGSSQELSGWSQPLELNEAPELIVSEDISGTKCLGWDPSMTILESERQEECEQLQEPELLRSDEFHKISSPPLPGANAR